MQPVTLRPPSLGRARASTTRRAAGWALRAGASGLVLLAVAAAVGGDALRAGTAVLAPGPVAAAVLLGLVWRGLAATRWLLVARALGAPLAWPQAYAEYLRSELLNQVLPGAVLGDLDRARRHGRDVGLLPSARAVVLERVAGQAVLVAAVVAVVVARPELLLVARGADSRTVGVLVAVVALVGLVGALLWRPWQKTRPVPVAEAPVGDPAPVPPRVEGAVLVPALAGALVLSVGVLACFVALFVLSARVTGSDAAGSGAALGDLVPAVLVVLVLAGVPLTVAGWGAREAGAALGFAAVGLAAADGVAAAVGYGLLSLVSALPGLVPLLLPRLRPVGRGRGPLGSAPVS